jgi:hypothetical protein
VISGAYRPLSPEKRRRQRLMRWAVQVPGALLVAGLAVAGVARVLKNKRLF